MKPNRLVTDTQPIDQPQGSYRSAFNILKNKAKEAISNEEGFEKILILGKFIHHVLAIDKDHMVIFSSSEGDYTADLTTNCAIGILSSEGVYKLIIKDDGFKFYKTAAFKSIYLRNFKKELIVSWVDGINPNRILNLDAVPFELTVDKELVNPRDIDLMNIVPGSESANISILEVENKGGQLETGVYFFTSVYELDDRSLTKPGFIMGPVSIAVGGDNDPPINYNGSDPGIGSGKSIQLNVSNIDQRYSHIRLIVAKKIGGIVTAQYFIRKKITGTQFNYVYSGNEDVEEIPLVDFLSQAVVYDSSKTITYHNNTLFLANLKSNRLQDYNYQSIAKDIKIDWVLDTVNIDKVPGSYKDEFTIATKKTFFPDEVYAFYVRFLFDNNTKSDAFHIPGPSEADRSSYFSVTGQPFKVTDRIQDIIDAGVTSYNTPYANEPVVSDITGLNHDLGIDSDIKFFHTRETAINRPTDNMGVWYNEDEKYPNDPTIWGDLADTPVRHHKFPSLDVFVDKDNPIIEGKGVNTLELGTPMDLHLKMKKSLEYDGDITKDYGIAYALPLKVTNVSDPSVKSQNFMFPAADDVYGESRTLRLRSGRRYVNEFNNSIYKDMKRSYKPLFFYDCAEEDKSIRVDYDLAYQIGKVSKAVEDEGGAVQIKIHIGHFHGGAGLDAGNNTTPIYIPYDGASDGEIRSYGIDSFADPVNTREHILTERSGSHTINLVKGDSLCFIIEYFIDEGTYDGYFDTPIHLYRCNLNIEDLSQPAGVQEAATSKILGIDVKNINIPAEISDHVVGYEILYAKRDLSNMRVLGQSLLFGSAPHPLDYTRLGSHAGNNLSYSREGDKYHGAIVPYLRDDKIRFHAFDLMHKKPNVSPSFVKVNARLRTRRVNEIGEIEARFWDPALMEDDGRLDENTPIQAHYACDFITRGNEPLDSCDEYDRVRPINNFKYVPADGIIGYDDEILDNTYSEECGIFSVEHFEKRIEPGHEDIGVANGWLPSNPNFFHTQYSNDNENSFWKFVEDEAYPMSRSFLHSATYFLGSIYNHNINLYSSLFEQELVSTGKLHLTGKASGVFTTGNLFGGDSFFSLYGMRLTSAIYRDNLRYASLNKHEALKTIYYFPCYTAANVNLRTPGKELKDDFYPNVGTDYTSYVDWVKRPADNENSNIILYNDDYTSVNDLSGASVFNVEDEFLTEFPYRVIKGESYNPENKELSLRNFAANDKMEMPKDRGEIVNVEGFKNTLLIHHKYALYATVTQDTLATDENTVTLGTGDIFRMEPKELVVSETGYLGTQDMSTCFISKAGYFFIDSEKGKIFLFDGNSPKEISAIDNMNFFRDEFSLQLITQIQSLGIDIPHDTSIYKLLNIGYSVGFDPKYDRIIISKIDYKIPTNVLESGITYKEAVGLVHTDTEIKLTPAEYDSLLEKKHCTISFNARESNWTCYHNYFTSLMITTRNHLFSIDSGNIYKHNSGPAGTYYDGIKYPSFIDMVFNQGAGITKMFQSLQWITEVVASGNSKHDKTFTSILCYNTYQNSGYITLLPKTVATPEGNTRNVEGTWSFNAFRDIVADRSQKHWDNGEPVVDNLDEEMPWYNQKRFTDKFMIVRFLYDNLAGNTLYLYDLSASFLKSNR